LREKCRLRVFENRVLRKIFVPKRNVAKWRELHNVRLNFCTFHPKFVWMIKLRRVTCVKILTRGGKSGVYRVLVGNVRERQHLEGLGVDRIILRWLFRKCDVGAWDG
jgi:hypothetical protein